MGSLAATPAVSRVLIAGTGLAGTAAAIGLAAARAAVDHLHVVSASMEWPRGAGETHVSYAVHPPGG